MTVPDVAERLEVSISLVYRLVQSGKLRCTRHGVGRGVIRISEAQLADYLATVEHGAHPPPRDAPVTIPPLKHIRL